MSAGFLGLFLTLLFQAIYPEYLDIAVLYHSRRADLRHSLSLFFVALHHYSSPAPLLGIPQLILSLLCVVYVYRKEHSVLFLPRSFAITIMCLVALQRVLTVQYFAWFFPFLALLPWPSSSFPFLFWGFSLASWLFFAYLQEFQGLNMFFWLFISSSVFFLAQCNLIANFIK